MKLDFNKLALSKPSKASPPLKLPSPIILITLYFSFFKSRAFAKPKAKLTEVEVCPILNKSCSLSFGVENPLTLVNKSSFKKYCLRLVNIL